MSDTRRRISTHSIKFKLLFMLLGIAALAVFVLAAIFVNSARLVGNRAQQIIDQTITTQVQGFLTQLNARSAQEYDLLLDQVARDVQKVAASVAAVYAEPDRYMAIGFWPPAQNMFFGPNQQYVNGPDDTSSVFVPNGKVLSDEILQDIELSAYLDLVLPAVFHNNPSAEAIYFATPRDVVRYYPNVNLGAVLPADFKASERVWFTGSTLSNNPERRTWWTPVYADATGLGLVTTAAMPVYNGQQELIGVVGFDLTLEGIRSSIETNQFLEGGYSFLLDQTGHAIALPEQGYRDILGRSPTHSEVNPHLNTAVDGFSLVLSRMLKGESGLQAINLNGKDLFVAYTPLASTGWSLGSVVAAESVLKVIPALQAELNQNARNMMVSQGIPPILLVLGLLVLAGWMWTNRMVAPIQNLVVAVKKLGTGNWDITIPKAGDDEIGLLANTFETMKEQLHTLVNTLEQRVMERTHDLERRSVQIQTASEIARDITTTENLNTLLETAVNLIRDRFGFYHAGVFLVDEPGEYAHLRAATGDAGRQMLERRHKLKVGEEGLVGYVTGTGQPRIALDTGKDAVHFKNPLLPDTRSELALPLKISTRVIGALDVQSTAPAAFDQEDAGILQTLADQLAVAIQNVRLFEALEATLQETSKLYHRQAQEAWSLAATQAKTTAYEYDRLEVRPLPDSLPVEATALLQDGHSTILQADLEGNGAGCPTLLVPVKLRGEVIGLIGLESESTNHHWSADEIAIVEAAANQASLTLENARLLAETQRLAERRQVVTEVATRIRETLDIDTVIRTAAQEVQKGLGLPEVIVRLSSNR